MDSLLSLLSKEDLELIDFYRTTYGKTLKDPVPENKKDIEYILRIWAENKKELAKIFNGQLMVQKEVSYIKSSDELTIAINKALDSFPADSKLALFVDAYRDLINMLSKSHTCNVPELDTLLSGEALSENKVIYSFEIDYQDIHIAAPVGAKTSKILGKVSRKFEKYIPNLKYYEDFRIFHSQILNQKEVYGQLVLSIHPMDFLTMSDNDSDWSSCMTWVSDTGDYRLGTVEMMNSPYVVCAYLNRANSSTDLYHGYFWNNKKWRELFIVNPYCIANVHGYPYSNDSLEKEVISMLKEMTEKATDFKYINKPIIWNKNTLRVENDRNYYGSFSFDTGYMYNDFLYTHYILPADNLKQDIPLTDEDKKYFHINYSGPAECMWCGSIENDFEEENFVFCIDCEKAIKCKYCGRDLSELTDGEQYFYLEGNRLCWECFNDYTYYDIFDGQLHSVAQAKIYKVRVDTSNGMRFLGRFYTQYEPGDKEWEALLPGVKVFADNYGVHQEVNLKDLPISFLKAQIPASKEDVYNEIYEEGDETEFYLKYSLRRGNFYGCYRECIIENPDQDPTIKKSLEIIGDIIGYDYSEQAINEYYSNF